jgi:hypothetical protein
MDPEFPAKLRRGEVEESECDYCNRCVAEMEAGGIHCVTLEERSAKRDGASDDAEP